MQSTPTTPRGTPTTRGTPNLAWRLKPYPSRTKVSDSEEERQRRIRVKRAALATVDQNELPVIVISSDEEDASESVVAQKGTHFVSQTVSLSVQGTTDPPQDNVQSDIDFERPPPVTPKRRQRRIALGSDSSDADSEHAETENVVMQTPAARRKHPVNLDDDVIDLTLSSPEGGQYDVTLSLSTKEPSKLIAVNAVQVAMTDKKKKASATKDTEKKLPLFLDDSESELDNEDGVAKVPDDPFSADGGALLILNEPRSAQKLVRRTPRFIGGTPNHWIPSSVPTKELAPASEEEDEGDKGEAAGILKPEPRTLMAGVRSVTSSPGPSKLSANGKGKVRTPRMTQKALREIELERRRVYAQGLFNELNETIFGGGIPATTALEWSNKLYKTAGRAKWHRTRHGVDETSIELAEKILDSDERIRNTLSHEMCHLACWIIDKEPNENHGSLFQAWAQRVMRKRPEIEVATRHSYEIKCKYEWKCANCAKLYGRHSKSINPDECVCGVCKVGELVPQFKTKPRAPRTPKAKADSQNAATRSRDSPLVMPGALSSPGLAVRAGRPTSAARPPLTEGSDADDSDVEILAHTLKTVRMFVGCEG